jgi:4-hydroxythreonine-4-phosphate dehydrogenase
MKTRYYSARKDFPVAAADHPIVAITLGDPAGIGPEIVAKFLAGHKKTSYTVVVLGDLKWLEDAAQSCDLKLEGLNIVTRAQRDKFVPGAINLIPVKAAFKDVKPGHPNARTGRAAMAFVEKATDLVLLKEVDAVVTAPISKKAINDAGFYFAGHTEYFAERTNTSKYAICFVADEWRVALVTGHVALRKVHSRVKLARVIRTINLLDQFLRVLGTATPRIAVSGLNPHAGEEGLLGSEEKNEIAPGVEACRAHGLQVSGPMSAEAAFVGHGAGKYDGVVAMYHDQGLVPLKAIAPFKAVNLTLGLPFIRTSVGHGAAWDIAGKGVAKADGMKNAVAMAVKLIQAGARP